MPFIFALASKSKRLDRFSCFRKRRPHSHLSPSLIITKKISPVVPSFIFVCCIRMKWYTLWQPLILSILKILLHPLALTNGQPLLLEQKVTIQYQANASSFSTRCVYTSDKEKMVYQRV